MRDKNDLIKRLTCFLALGLGLTWFIMGAIMLISPRHPWFYLIDIFTLPLLSTGVLITGLVGILYRYRWPVETALSALLLSLTLMAFSLWPQTAPKQLQPVSDTPAFRLMFANLWVQNKTPEMLFAWVEKQDPDMVVLIEASQTSIATLNPRLKARYPYVVRRFDMYVFSRFPLDNAQARPYGFGLLTVSVKTPHGRFPLAVVHNTRPWPYSAPNDQARQLAQLKRELTPFDKNRLIVVGDFNASPAARRLQDFCKDTGLHPAPALKGTWPTFLPSLLRISIDNVFGGSQWYMNRRRVGPNYGSDHRPVVVDFTVAKPAI
jgi:endonuclease/exonuclease/phosphatase (EEP) superfamily protein YafD